MTDTEFIEKEIKLIEDIKSSDVYLRYKELSRMVENDSTLLSLSKERDEILLKMDSSKDKEEKEKLILLYHKKEKEIESVDLMKEYKLYYEKIKKIINHLSDGLNKEIL